jgi:hypothetical protein
MKYFMLLLMCILSFVQIKPEVRYDWDYPDLKPKKEIVTQKDIITPNERALSDAVMLTIIQLSDRQAVYAKQVVLLEKDIRNAQNSDELKCIEDTKAFFASLTLAVSEQEVRSLHKLFADRFVECQKMMHSLKNGKVS